MMIIIIMFTVAEVLKCAVRAAQTTDSTLILIDRIIIYDVIHGIVPWYSALYHG